MTTHRQRAIIIVHTYEPNPTKYGTNLDDIVHEIESPPSDANSKKCIQQVLGSYPYHARKFDMSMLYFLSIEGCAEKRSIFYAASTWNVGEF